MSDLSSLSDSDKGQRTDSPSPGDHSLKDVAQWLSDGRAVTTGSHKDGGFLWWHGDGEYIDSGKVVTAHEYSVQSVDMNPPTVTLLNPWGSARRTAPSQSARSH